MPLERVAFIAQDVEDFGDVPRIVYPAHWEDMPSRADVEAVSADVSEAFFGDRRIELRPGKPRNERTLRADAELERRLRERNAEPQWSGAETFDSLEEALAWARERAPRVIVRLGLQSHWSAGPDPVEDLPPWPATCEERSALTDELLAFLGDPRRAG